MATDSEGFVVRLSRGQSKVPGLVCRPGEAQEPFTIGTSASWTLVAEGVQEIHTYMYFDGTNLYVCGVGPEVRVNDLPIPTNWVGLRPGDKLTLGSAELTVQRPKARGREPATTAAAAKAKPSQDKASRAPLPPKAQKVPPQKVAPQKVAPQPAAPELQTVVVAPQAAAPQVQKGAPQPAAPQLQKVAPQAAPTQLSMRARRRRLLRLSPRRFVIGLFAVGLLAMVGLHLRRVQAKGGPNARRPGSAVARASSSGASVKQKPERGASRTAEHAATKHSNDSPARGNEEPTEPTLPAAAAGGSHEQPAHAVSTAPAQNESPRVATRAAAQDTARSTKTRQRRAADAIAAADLPAALAIYRTLASEDPNNPAFAEAVQILSRKVRARRKQ